MHLGSGLHWLLTALQQTLYSSKNVGNNHRQGCKSKAKQHTTTACAHLFMTIDYSDSAYGVIYIIVILMHTSLVRLHRRCHKAQLNYQSDNVCDGYNPRHM